MTTQTTETQCDMCGNGFTKADLFAIQHAGRPVHRNCYDEFVAATREIIDWQSGGSAIEIRRGHYCYEVKWPVTHQDARGLCDGRAAALAYARELQKDRFPQAIIIDHTEPDPPKAAPIPTRNRILEQVQRAFENGQRARGAGKGVLANRYPMGSPLRTAWTSGWVGREDAELEVA